MSAPDRSSPNSQSFLVGLALLRGGWDVSEQTYLDHFVPLVADVLYQMTTRPLPLHDVSQALRKRRGLNVPDGVVECILQRGVDHGWVTVRDGQYYVSHSNARDKELQDNRRSVERQLTALFTDFSNWAETQLDLQLNEHEAEQSLLAYVECRAVPLLRAVLTDSPAPPLEEDAAASDYAVARYIQHLDKQDPDGFSYLETLVKSSMIASSLYWRGMNLDETSFADVVFYLDTPVLLEVLGYADEAVVAAARDLVSAITELGGKLACLDITVQELRGIFRYAERVLRNEANLPSAFSDVAGHFLRRGGEPSDALQAGEHLPDDLAAGGIEVVARPEPVEAYTLDEVALAKKLQEVVGYLRPQTREHDLRALTAIHTLRRGAVPTRLEDARAVFVTDNDDLVRAAERFSEFGGRANQWTVAMRARVLATLAWLRSPTAFPDLPRRQVLADCYAAMQPSPAVWRRAVEVVQTLQEQGAVGAEELSAFRHSLEARRLLMDRTRGSASAVDEETLRDVVESLTEEAKGPLVAEIEQLKQQEQRLVAERDEAHQSKSITERSLADVKADNAAMREDLGVLSSWRSDLRRAARARAERLAKMVEVLIVWLLIFAGGALGLGTAYNVVWGPLADSLPRLAAGLVAAGLVVALMVAYLFKGHMWEAPRRAGEWARPHLCRRALAKFSLPDDDADSGDLAGETIYLEDRSASRQAADVEAP